MLNLRTEADRQKPFLPVWPRVFALLCLLLLTTGASAQAWKSIGPSGGDVRALAVDPANSELLYLGTTDGHIFGSRDGGDHWSLLGLAGAAPNAIVTAILVDPRNSRELFASNWTREPRGEGGGVFLSRDGGRSWRETGLAGHAVRALAQAPSDPDILIAGALDGIFRSRNHGAGWERISPEGDLELRNVDSLSIDPRAAETIIVGTFHLPWKTTDGGEHWIPIHRGMLDDSDVLSLALDPANPQRIFASACSGIYRSDDAGNLWQKIEGIPYSSRRTPVIRIDPANPAILFAGTTEGLWRSADGGAHWRRISPGDWIVNSMVVEPPREKSAALQDPSRPGRILVGTEDLGVLVSDDGGGHFRQANDGFLHRSVLSLAMDSENPGKIAAVISGAPNSVLASDDGGTTWLPIGAGISSYGVQHVFSSPDGWWAALAAGGLARFDPETGVWTRAGLMTESKVERPATPRNQIVRKPTPFTAHVNDLSFSGSAWFAAANEGLFVSTDAGTHWSAMLFAPAALPVDSVRVTGGGRRLRIATSLAMVFSDDAGVTWRWGDLPLESGGVIRLELADDSAFLALARNGLYISRDSGTSWRRAGAGLPHVPLSDIFVRPGLWLASVESGGLYFSRDQGWSWLRVQDPANAGSIGEHGKFHKLVVESRTGLIYAGSATEGLFVLDLSPAPATASLTATGK